MLVLTVQFLIVPGSCSSCLDSFATTGSWLLRPEVDCTVVAGGLVVLAPGWRHGSFPGSHDGGFVTGLGTNCVARKEGNIRRYQGTCFGRSLVALVWVLPPWNLVSTGVVVDLWVGFHLNRDFPVH